MIKILCLFLFFTSFNVFPQDSSNLCEKIYGEWKTCYIQLPFDIDVKSKSEVWIFNADGTLIIDGKTNSYILDDDCSKLFIGDDPNFFVSRIIGNELYITRKIFPHESYVFRFKKVIKK